MTIKEKIIFHFERLNYISVHFQQTDKSSVSMICMQNLVLICRNAECDLKEPFYSFLKLPLEICSLWI